MIYDAAQQISMNGRRPFALEAVMQVAEANGIACADAAAAFFAWLELEVFAPRSTNDVFAVAPLGASPLPEGSDCSG